MLFSAYYSNTDQVREFHKNGTVLKSANNVTITNAGLFKFPNSPWHQGDYTVGEIIVIKDTITKDLRQQLEGYLAQKWKLTSELPSQHPYLSVFPNLMIRDNGQKEITNFIVEKSDDNSSLRIRFTPDKSPNKFTVSVNSGLGIDSNDMLNKPTSFSFAYGRPITRLDALTGWWSFDDENTSYVTDYFDRFNGIFVSNEIDGVKYDVTYTDGLFGSALNFPGDAWVKTSGSASGLGISGNNPRTVSFWIKAQSGSTANSVIYALGDRPGNSGGGRTAWGMQGVWGGWRWARSFYNRQSNNFSNPKSYHNTWRHIAHVYDGSNVLAYVDGVLRLSAVHSLDTKSRTALTFGHFGESTRGWNNDHFVGQMDDFRVYNDALVQDEISILYGNGYGDISIQPEISIFGVVQGLQSHGSIIFKRGGEPISVPSLSTDDFSVVNGSMVDGSLSSDDNLTWNFSFSLEVENLSSSVSINPGAFTDGYAEASKSSSASTVKMYRAVTRGGDLGAWWSFDRDSFSSNEVFSDAVDATMATLYDAVVSPKGRFGPGLAFDRSSKDGRMKIEPNGIDLNDNGWAISVWCKNLLPPQSGGQSTLFRGQDKQADYEFDHYLSYRASDRSLGLIDGDIEDETLRFMGSGYLIDPLELDGWRHFAVVGEGQRTRYFVNGIFVGEVSQRDQSDLYYVGNSSGNELFSEFIDDLRIYRVSLSQTDIGKIYGGGFGDMFPSLKVESNSSTGETPQRFHLHYGNDGTTKAIDGLNQDFLSLKYGEILELNASEDNSSYLLSILPDPDRSAHEFQVPDKPVRFDNLSLWLDASDPQGGSDSFKSSIQLTLWLDAADATSITTTGNEMDTWENKVNPDVKMSSWSNKPSYDASINSVAAIDINSANGQREGFNAYKNGSAWSPASANGVASGPVEDVVVILAWRVDTNNRTTFPFNFGWGDHLPWSNGSIFWHFSDNRKSVNIASNNESVLTILEFSTTKGIQNVYKDGSLKLTGPRTSPTNIGGAFFFPGNGGDSNYNPDFTLGELLVLRGILSEEDRSLYEGYLAHKWGLTGKLPNSHPYKTSQAATVFGDSWNPSNDIADIYWTDKSNSKNHALAYQSPVLIDNAQNGLDVMSYNGLNSESHSFSMISDIRTVFWVLSEDSSVAGSGLRYLLGDTTEEPHWHNNNDGKLWGTTWGNSNIYNGYTRLNGTLVDGKTTNKPTELSIVSLRTLEDVQANNFSNDRNIGGRSWKGKLAELLIYNQALTDNEIEYVEGYLAHKWDLNGSIDPAHTYKVNPPAFAVGQSFTYGENLQVEPFLHSFDHFLPAYREDELISRWSFDELVPEDSGLNRVHDLAKGRNDGYLRGNAQLTTGRFKNALTLDGSGDYLDIPSFRGGYKSKSLTFSAWIKLANTGSSDDSDDGSIFSTAGSTSNHSRLWYDVNADTVGSRTYSLTLGSPVALYNRSSGSDGLGIFDRWQLLTAVMDADQRTLYVDGKLVAQTSSPTSSISLEGSDSRIGSWDQDNEADFAGLIDEMRIYSISMTQEDINGLWNSGSGDLGILPIVDIHAEHAANEVNATIRFIQANNDVNVSGFDSSDLDLIGASLDSFTSDGSGSYLISLNPNHPGTPISLSIRANGAIGPDGVTTTGQTSTRIAYSPAVSAMESLVLRYEFEGDESNQVLDLSSRQVDASRFGGKLIPGKFSQSFALHPGDYLVIPGAGFSFNQSFTLSLWAKILDDMEGVILANGQVRLEYQDDLKIHAFARIDGTWKRTSAFAKPGKWAHYTLVRDPSYLSLFINGEELAKVEAKGALGWENENDFDLYLGRPVLFTPGMDAKFELDSLRIYDRPISGGEVAELYGDGTGDMGVRPLVSGESPFAVNPTDQNITFRDAGFSLTLSGLLSSEINATGGNIFNFDSSNLSYELNASTQPSIVRVSLPHGAVIKDGNLSQAGAFEFQNRPILSTEDDLVAWYTFDENLGSIIKDHSGNLRNGHFLSADLSTTENSNISTSETSSTSYPKSNAFDNNIESANDKWLAKWDGTPVYIQYDFGAVTEISSYAVYAQNADEEVKSPKAWTLSGSLDNSGWTVIDTVSDQTNWGEWERRIFSLPSTESYRYYKLTFTETTGNALPTSFQDLEVWYDANDIDADGIADSISSGNINSWFDKSGNQYHANGGGNSPYLDATGGPSGGQTIDVGGGKYLNINGNIFCKDHFYVFRSPNPTWDGYGGVLGHNPASGHNQRNSNYITQHNNTTFHGNQYPSGVWRFGSSLASPFDLAPIDEFMIVRLQVNDNQPGPYESYQVGRSTGLQCNLEISEIVAYSTALSDSEADRIEGYLAHKWGLSDQLSNNHPLTYLSLGEIEFFAPPVIETGKFGYALDLTDDRIELPFRTDQSYESKGLTLAMWIRPDSVNGIGNNPSILLSTEDGGYDWSIGFQAGFPFVRTGKLELTTPQQAYAGNWMHFASVFDTYRSQVQVYLNGNPASLNSLGFDSSTSRLFLGTDPDGSNPYDGLVDDLRIWNRSLSSQQVRLLYGNNMGDLGPKAVFDISSPVYDSEINATLSFNQIITDFNASSDLSFTGLSLLGISTEDNQTYNLTLQPLSFTSSTLQIQLNENSVTDSHDVTNLLVSETIDFRPHQVAESDLLIWWKLDGDAQDASGNDNHGTISSPDWNSSGKFNSSLSLDNTDGRSVIHTGLASDIPATTITVWVHPKSENFHIFQSDGSSPSLFFNLERRRPLFSLSGLDQAYLPGTSTEQIHGRGYLPLNQWSHLGFTYDLDARRARIFINGKLDLESSFAGNLPFPTSAIFRLGPPDSIDSTFGEVDDFRLYNRALSINEVQQIYGQGKGDFNNHTIELSHTDTYELPILVTARFLRDGFPVDVNASFNNSDATITSANASLNSITKISTGEYLIVITPDNNESTTNISLLIDGSSITSKYFGETFENSSIALVYNPQLPLFSSPEISRWTRGVYSEFKIEANNHLTLSATGLPGWLEFNETTSILSGLPNDGNSSQIVLTAANPAYDANQSHRVEVFDPSVFSSHMELTPRGVLSDQTLYDLPGLILQLDGSAINEVNGTSITSWKDSSGNGRDLDQSRGAPKVRTNIMLGSRKVVHFDGFSQLYSSVDFGTLIEDYTIISLIRHTGGLDQAVIASVGTDWIFGLGDGKSAYWKIDTNILPSSPSADEQWHLITGSIERDGTVKLWRDGFLVHQSILSYLNDSKPGRLAVGGAQANDSFSKSEVAEVLLYDRSLKEGEKTDVEDHLRLKWLSDDLRDFPMLVRLGNGQHPDFDHGTFADSEEGGDLRIYDENRVPLPYEIDEWNVSTGESTLWVRVGEVNPNLNLFAYWGNDLNTTTPSYRSDGSVWADYAGVWHFSNYTDSTSNNRNASASGSPQTNSLGVSGYALQLSGTTDKLSISGYNGLMNDSTRSIETWVFSEQSESGILGWGGFGNNWNLRWNNQGPLVSTDNGSTKRQGSGNIGNGKWNHILISYPGNGSDINNARIYLNGRLSDAPASSVDGTVNTTEGNDLVLGGLANGSSLLDGWLDETRISPIHRSQAWARISYESQRNDETFFFQDLVYLQAPVMPADLNLTVVKDTSMQFQLSSNPPATLYELSGPLPGGLNFNQATGTLSGTPTETGGFELNATATNAQGSSTVRFLVNSVENIEAPVLEAGSVDEVGGTTVDLTGKLISSGGTLCNISLYYGTADQNETTGAWEYSLALGTLGQGDIPASLSTLDSGKTYYYRFKGGNPTESWSDVGTFTTLPYDQGILRIHTGMDDGGFGAGWFWDNGNGNGEQKIFEPILTQSLYFAPDGSSWTLTKAIFDFNESLNIGQNLERVILEGVNALSIQVKGNLTIGHSLNASLFSSTPHLEGGSLSDGYDGYYPDSAINGSLLARGNLGGYGGGQGPGKGLSSGRIYKGGASGGGGSFGGEGGPGASGASGILYGSAGLEYLIGGSGGGLGNIGEAGAGGGALELNASGKILIDQGVRISLRGGTVFVNPQVGANFSGGAGSGGALKLIGASIENRGVLDLQGGDAPGVDPREPGVRYLRNAGGAGGGGRIAMLSDGEIITGTTLTEGGQGNSDGAPGLPGTLYTGRLHSDTVQSLEFSSGTLVFDTSGTWKHSAGSTGKGVIQASSILVDGRPYGYSVCEFSFSNLSIGPDVSVVVKGRNSLRLIVDGNATIGTDIRLDGKSGKSEIYSGIPGPGGWSSGRALSDADLPGISNIALSGMGPGGGKGIDDITPISSGGSHGGYGSAGQNNGSVGHLYGDSNITHLVGGSGGGRSAGRYADAGGGGGALSLIVANTFILEGNATLSANGGKGISKSIGSGSGGAGGSIRIEAQHLLNLGRIETLGGDANASGGPGGGGKNYSNYGWFSQRGKHQRIWRHKPRPCQQSSRRNWSLF